MELPQTPRDDGVPEVEMPYCEWADEKSLLVIAERLGVEDYLHWGVCSQVYTLLRLDKDNIGEARQDEDRWTMDIRLGQKKDILSNSIPSLNRFRNVMEVRTQAEKLKSSSEKQEVQPKEGEMWSVALSRGRRTILECSQQVYRPHCATKINDITFTMKINDLEVEECLLSLAISTALAGILFMGSKDYYNTPLGVLQLTEMLTSEEMLTIGLAVADGIDKNRKSAISSIKANEITQKAFEMVSKRKETVEGWKELIEMQNSHCKSQKERMVRQYHIRYQPLRSYQNGNTTLECVSLQKEIHISQDKFNVSIGHQNHSNHRHLFTPTFIQGDGCETNKGTDMERVKTQASTPCGCSVEPEIDAYMETNILNYHPAEADVENKGEMRCYRMLSPFHSMPLFQDMVESTWKNGRYLEDLELEKKEESSLKWQVKDFKRQFQLTKRFSNHHLVGEHKRAVQCPIEVSTLLSEHLDSLASSLPPNSLVKDKRMAAASNSVIRLLVSAYFLHDEDHTKADKYIDLEEAKVIEERLLAGDAWLVDFLVSRLFGIEREVCLSHRTTTTKATAGRALEKHGLVAVLAAESYLKILKSWGLLPTIDIDNVVGFAGRCPHFGVKLAEALMKFGGVGSVGSLLCEVQSLLASAGTS